MSSRKPLVLTAVTLVVLFTVAASPIIAATGAEVTTADSTRSDLKAGSSAISQALQNAPASQAADDRPAGQLQQSQSEVEPNDDGASANVIGPGAQVSGTLASAEDVDIFAVDLSQSTTLQATLSRPSGDGVLALVLYNSQGEFANGSFVDPGTSAQVSIAAQQPGRYFVAVASGSRFQNQQGESPPAGSGPYALGVSAGQQASPTPGQTVTPGPTSTPGATPTPSSGGGASETEPNDDLSQANLVTPGVSVSGAVSSVAEGDFYAVDVAQSTTLQVSLSRSSGDGALGFAILDPQGNGLTGRLVPVGNTTTLTAPVSPGRYYVVVASGSQFTLSDGQPGPAGTGPYTIQAATGQGQTTPTATPGGTPTPTGFETPTPSGGTQTPGAGTQTPGAGTQTPEPFGTPTATPGQGGATAAESEPNDGPDQANPVQQGVRVQGALESSGDSDWFTFQGQAGQTINASFFRQGGEGSFRLIYYTQEGRIFEVVDAVQPGGGGVLFATLPTTGNYYLRVDSQNGSGPYAFAVSPVSGSGTEATDDGLTVEVGPSLAENITIDGADAEVSGETRLGDLNATNATADTVTETAVTETATEAAATETAATETVTESAATESAGAETATEAATETATETAVPETAAESAAGNDTRISTR